MYLVSLFGDIRLYQKGSGRCPFIKSSGLVQGWTSTHKDPLRGNALVGVALVMYCVRMQRPRFSPLSIPLVLFPISGCYKLPHPQPPPNIYLVVLLKKLFDSLFISSDLNLLISSSIFRISASNLSLILLNSVSITLKSPNLMGMSRRIPSDILLLLTATTLHCTKHVMLFQSTRSRCACTMVQARLMA